MALGCGGGVGVEVRVAAAAVVVVAAAKAIAMADDDDDDGVVVLASYVSIPAMACWRACRASRRPPASASTATTLPMTPPSWQCCVTSSLGHRARDRRSRSISSMMRRTSAGLAGAAAVVAGFVVDQMV